MKANCQVANLHGADREITDNLVRQYGGELLAIVSANHACGRSNQAFLRRDGHVLAMIPQRHAEAMGVQFPNRTPHVILAMPEDCEIAQSIEDHINTDPAPFEVELDDVN